MKNEVFYKRAQQVRNSYAKSPLRVLYLDILIKIIVEIFSNNDNFPAELVISCKRCTKDMVEEILNKLRIEFTDLRQNGDYFFIRDPHL